MSESRKQLKIISMVLFVFVLANLAQSLYLLFNNQAVVRANDFVSFFGVVHIAHSLMFFITQIIGIAAGIMAGIASWSGIKCATSPRKYRSVVKDCLIALLIGILQLINLLLLSINLLLLIFVLISCALLIVELFKGRNVIDKAYD